MKIPENFLKFLRPENLGGHKFQSYCNFSKILRKLMLTYDHTVTNHYTVSELWKTLDFKTS